MMRKIIGLVVGLTLLWGEPQELNTIEGVPYGLASFTQTQKQQQETVSSLQKQVRMLELEMSKLRGIVDELKGMIVSLNVRQQDLEKNESKPVSYATLEDIQKVVSQQKLLQETNDKSLQEYKGVLENLVKEIETLKIKNVTKDELQASLIELQQNSEKNVTKSLSEKEMPKESVDTRSWQNLPATELETIALSELVKGSYQTSLEKWEWLGQKNYKKPFSLYKKGESLLGLKRYADAINAYKQSYELSATAEYIPTLLFHTAGALEKLNDVQGAVNVYTTLSSGYPHSREAGLAKGRLKVIKTK